MVTNMSFIGPVKPTRISASGVINADRSVLAGLYINSGTNVTISVFDNSDGSGTAKIAVPASAAGTLISFPNPIEFSNGLYLTLGGTTPNVTALWR